MGVVGTGIQWVVVRVKGGAAAAATCSKCVSPPRVFCVDCNANFCMACSCRAHHPGTTAELHSLEKITKEEKQNIKIFTPLAEEILCATMAYILYSHRFVQEDYLYNATICPLGSYAQWTVASFDSGIFYLLKGTFSWECGMEDAYWRLWTDSWVRNIITSSDGVALILPSLFRAWVFKQALCISLVPFLAMVYSVVFLAISFVESFIPRVEPFISIEKVVLSVDLLPFESQLPPETQSRKRPSQDFVEAFYYWKSRYLRKVYAFYNASSTALIAVIIAPVKYLVGFRLVCIFLPEIGQAIRVLLSYVPIFHATIESHSSWFKNSPHADHGFTDHILERVFSAGYAFITSGILRNVLAPVLNFATVLAGDALEFWILGLPMFIYWVIKYAILKVRQRQQADFNLKWNSHLRAEVLGGCSADDRTACQCACIQEKCRTVHEETNGDITHQVSERYG